MFVGCPNVGLMGGKLPAFPEYVATSKGTSGTGTGGHTNTLPNGIQAGDIILIIIGSSYTTAPTINVPSGFSALSSNINNGRSSIRAVYKVANGTESGTGISITAGTAYTCSVAMILRGCKSLEHASGTTSSGSVDCPNLTPSWGEKKTLWIAAAAVYTLSYTPSTPSGYSNFDHQDGAVSGGIDWPDLMWATKESEASSENPPAFGGSPSGGWNATLLTIACEPE